jgi:hypothetical protein
LPQDKSVIAQNQLLIGKDKRLILQNKQLIEQDKLLIARYLEIIGKDKRLIAQNKQLMDKDKNHIFVWFPPKHEEFRIFHLFDRRSFARMLLACSKIEHDVQKLNTGVRAIVRLVVS